MGELSELPAASEFSFSDASFLSGSSDSGRVRRLIIIGVLLVGIVALATFIAAESFRARAIETNERELENTVLLLSRHFDQRLTDFTALQRDLATRLQHSQIESAEILMGDMSTLEVHETLRNRVIGSTDVAGINLFAADGTLINSSETWPPQKISVADREYFKRLKTRLAPNGEQIQIVRGRFNNNWTLVFAKSIIGKNGQFLGAVTRGMDPVSFEDFFSSIVLARGAAIGLYQSDGTLVARYPRIDDMIGQSFIDSPVHKSVLSNSEFGKVQLISPLDNVKRIAAARKLSLFPMSIIATTSLDVALADWRQQTVLLVTVATLTALVVALILYLITRKLMLQVSTSRRHLATALNNMSQGLLLYNSSARLILANARYIEMYQLSPDFVVPGKTLREIIVHRKTIGSFQGDVDLYCETVLKNVAEKRLTRSILHHSDGRIYQIVNQPLPEGGWVATHDDITSQKRSEDRISYLAQHDALTSLPNRTVLRERLGSLLDSDSGQVSFSLIYIDIDKFKLVNDSFGHRVGDELLRLLSQRLQNCVGALDTVSRLGGDEFAIIVRGIADRQDLQIFIEKLLGVIREPLLCLGHQIITDASIGIAISSVDGNDVETLIQNADLAMYDAKGSGRCGFRFFDQELEDRASIRRTLELALREALIGNEFSIYYQPIIDIKSNSICACEALLRWKSPKLGNISPVDFIPIAEETGIIVDLGHWVLRTACAEAASWPANIKLAVNVSPVQFSRQTFPLSVAAALAESGLAANRLELEITEAVLIQDHESALVAFNQIQELGVSLALDDFGTGFSSLSYLHRFPFNKVKIDRSFVNALDDPKRGEAIVQAVIDIALRLEITTTAEGVETQDQLALLDSMGCNQMQGYLASQPLPVHEIQALLVVNQSFRAQNLATTR